MAAFAADIVGVPRRRKTALCGVVMLLYIGAMTFGATCIPVLVWARPMQGVPGFNRVIGIEMIPTLSAFRF